MRDGYVRRIAENALGALVSAVGIAMMLQANVGLEPWSVLQEGMSNTMGITYGTASILVGAVIIAVSLLCGEPIGLGTVLNIVLCAVFIDGIQAMGWIPQMDTLWGGLLMLAAGLEILVIGTWLYMRTALGAGPRDSLMVALARKTGRSVGICRATVEIAVQVNGKLRAKLTVATGAAKEDAIAAAKAEPNVAKALEGKTICKEIYVPGKLVNIAVR